MMRRTFSRLKREDGFTLSEMLVVISILGLILGAFSLIFSSAIHHSGEIQEQNLLQTEVQGRNRQDRDARSGSRTTLGDTAPPPPIKMFDGDAAAVLLARQPAALPPAADLLSAQCRHARAGDGDEHHYRRTALGDVPRAQRVGPARRLGQERDDLHLLRQRQPDAVNATTTPANVRSVTITLSVATGQRRPSVHVHDERRSEVHVMSLCAASACGKTASRCSPSSSSSPSSAWSRSR